MRRGGDDHGRPLPGRGARTPAARPLPADSLRSALRRLYTAVPAGPGHNPCDNDSACFEADLPSPGPTGEWVGDALFQLACLRMALERGWTAPGAVSNGGRGLRTWLEKAHACLPWDTPLVPWLCTIEPPVLQEVWDLLAPLETCSPDALFRWIRRERTRLTRGGLQAQASERLQGRYYTPVALARFIVTQAIPITPGGDPVRVDEWTVLDLSCGSGVFLAEAARHLAAGRGEGVESPGEVLQQVVEKCLFGVDLDREAVRACRWNLMLLGLHDGRLPRVENRILFGNALLGTSQETLPWSVDAKHPRARLLADAWTCRCLDPDRSWPPEDHGCDRFLEGLDTGTLEWVRETAHRERFIHPWLDFEPVADGGFAAVVGNPPYLSELRRGATQSAFIRRSPRTSRDYQAKGDLFYYFLLEGMRLVRPGGRLGMLIPPYWRTRASGRRVREALEAWGSVRLRLDFGDRRLFEDAPGHHSEVLVVERGPGRPGGRVCQVLDSTVDLETVLAAVEHPDESAGVVRCLGTSDQAAGRGLVPGPGPRPGHETRPHPGWWRIRSSRVSQGLVMPQATLSRRGLARLSDGTARVGDGIFWLRDNELEALELNPAEQRLVKPYLPAGCIQPFRAGAPRGWVLYLDQAARKALEKTPERYPALVSHLTRFAPAITSERGPFQLHRSRSSHWFEGEERVLVVRKSAEVCAARVRGPRYVDQGVNVILVPDASQARYLVGLLCSRPVQTVLYETKRQGRMIQVDKETLVNLPLPPVPKPEPDHVAEVTHAARSGIGPVVALALQHAEDLSGIARAALEWLVASIEERLEILAHPVGPTVARITRPGRGGRFEPEIPLHDPVVQVLRSGIDTLVTHLMARASRLARALAPEPDGVFCWHVPENRR